MALKRPRLNGIVNRIHLVGIELEGGWAAPVAGENIEADGSVRFKKGTKMVTDPTTGLDSIVAFSEISGPFYEKGEIVSKPLQIPSVAEWMTKCYPPYINETCGLHVHMSFYHKLNYSRLMTADFTPHMAAALSAFGHKEGIPKEHIFWQRVGNPEHPWTLEHCAHVYLGDAQSQMRKKDYHSRGTKSSRYTAINYCEALHRPKDGYGTGTVECRLLPMLPTAEQAIRSVFCVLDATNKFLSNVRQRERRVSSVVTSRPGVFEEFGAVIR